MKILLALLLSLLPTLAAAQDVTIFAAASLKEPLDAFAVTQPGLIVSYSGSGTLARQVMNGAPADLVIMAHPDWVTAMDDADVIVSDSITDLLSNEIVLVGPQETPDITLDPVALTRALGVDGRLAIGLTGSVPAGIYGRQALESLGLWNSVSDRLVETDSARAALALVARGEVPIGLVYATDARVEPTLKIVARFPVESHAPILYQAAVVKDGNVVAAQAVLDALTTSESLTTFAAAGFKPAPRQ
ncbi:molybdate ABC transporter substrate-binding protein [Loktanella sp. SALINAS62]|uniref:molybdate ABC transporter substrate-binding protein n=1 Tax=Loktanella sp. SALINAS62 TaxID=2706124 RepID=UPI001B8C2E0C|nr:molybdate ABC transporter substrate-binding protein [Loktanella sp. SALINAS62]MBS1300803.1 molybdate ABC transporter substrate-binding protein [Loktanella sp. SALINAS62]